MPDIDELDQMWRDGLSATAAAMMPLTDPTERVEARVRRRRRSRVAVKRTGVFALGVVIVASAMFVRSARDSPRIATSGPETRVSVVAGPALRIRFPDRAVSGSPPRVELPRGKIRFTVRAVGGSHVLVIDGVPGFVAAVDGAKSVRKTVELAPGRYRIRCTIPGHTASGEEAILVVR